MSHKRSLNEAMNECNANHCPPKKQRLDSENEIKGLDENDNDHENVMIRNQLLQSGEPITLNVGGIKYFTSLSTLTSNTESILHKMFEGSFSMKPGKDGSYFIDRSGEYFKHILHYLRNNKLCIPNDAHLIDQLLLECDFYQLSSMKSALLLKKSQSSILRQGDTEFIQKCFVEDYPSFTKLNLSKSSLIFQGIKFPKYTKLKGINLP